MKVLRLCCVFALVSVASAQTYYNKTTIIPGTDIYTDSSKVLHFGPNSSSNYAVPNPAVVVGRTINTTGNAHEFTDVSDVTLTSTTSAYNSYDAAPTVRQLGTDIFTHYAGFQCRPYYSGAATIAQVRCFTSQYAGDAGGTVTNLYGVRVFDSILTNGSAVTNDYAFYADSHGTATNSWAFYSVFNPSYLAGSLYVAQGGTATKVFVGTATNTTVGSGSNKVQVEDITGAAGISIVRDSTGVSSPSSLRFGRSKGSTAGSVTTLASGDDIGAIEFAGADGTDLTSIAGRIKVGAGGTVSTGIVPGQFKFATANTSGTLVDALRIDADQSVNILQGGSVTGSLSINISSNGHPTSISTGTSTSQVALGGGSAPVIINSTTGGSIITGAITGTTLDATGVVTLSNSVVKLTGVTTGTNADFLCLSGTSAILLQTSACTISSLRFKENVLLFNGDALGTLGKFEIRTFRMKQDAKPNPDKNAYSTQIGLIAENIAKIEPRCAIYEQDMKTPKSYRQECVIALLVAGEQELLKQNRELKARLTKLETH